MFKVVENGDGFTNIFNKETGRLICTVRGNSKVGVGCRIPRSENVNSTSNCSSVHKIKDNALKSQPPRLSRTDNSVSDPLSSIDAYNEPEIPQPTIPDIKVTEDFFDDCISQEEFMRCLGAIPTQKLENNEIVELNKEFSVRWISRARPVEISQSFPDAKICDDVDLCSPHGSKLMNNNFSKNFINEATAMVCIKKYDSYCRFALSSTFINGGNFPKLRCREMKMYPLSYRPQKAVKLNCHMYSFNKRERLERIRTIKSGLNKKSRELYKLCKKKHLTVILKRLSENNIKIWTAKKVEPIPSTSTYTEPNNRSESPDFEILSVKRNTSAEVVTSALEHKQRPLQLARKSKPFTHSALQDSKLKAPNAVSSNVEYCDNAKMSGSKLNNSVSVNNKLQGKVYKSSSSDHYTKSYMNRMIRIISQKKCTVKLCDIVSSVYKLKNLYMVKGMKIKISNFDLIAKKISSQNYQCYARTKTKETLPQSLHFDHAYHRSLPENFIPDENRSTSHVSSATDKTSLQNKLKRLVLVKNPAGGKSYAIAPLQQKSLLKNNVPVPIIDLTIDEESPVPENTSSSKEAAISNKCTILEWEFHCFGCGHKCKFPQKAVADTKVMQHMRHFHSVSTPELFLSSYNDTVKRVAIIEAFPGYKRNFDD